MGRPASSGLGDHTSPESSIRSRPREGKQPVTNMTGVSRKTRLSALILICACDLAAGNAAAQ
ncbi:hypothetical protein RZS08_24430, partial [Arthrospira platensis SPKY1]|nr:hypothetical protein [Arthrospira platensis SPKY1]